MNWNVWLGYAYTTTIVVLAICAVWLVCATILMYKNKHRKTTTVEENKVKAGDRVKLVVEDPMIIEKIKLYQDRQDLYNEQITTYNDVIDSLNEELESTRTALTNGSVKGSYEKLKRKEGVLIKRIADYRLRVNKMMENSNKLTEQIRDLYIENGKRIL